MDNKQAVNEYMYDRPSKWVTFSQRGFLKQPTFDLIELLYENNE